MFEEIYINLVHHMDNNKCQVRRRPTALLCLISVLAIAMFQPLRGQQVTRSTQAPIVAISYFDNTSQEPELDMLRKGLADMLITDLSRSPDIVVVEREKLERELLKEIELGESRYIDPATAQRLGRGLGATYILTGAFLSLSPLLRIDARLISVETGIVKEAEQVTGGTDDLFQMEHQLASLLMSGLTLSYPTASPKLGDTHTADFNAVLDYSRSLDLIDHGQYETAESTLERAVSTYPEFEYAGNALRELKQKLISIEQSRQVDLEDEIKQLELPLEWKTRGFSLRVVEVVRQLTEDTRSFAKCIEFIDSVRSKIVLKEIIPGSTLTVREEMDFYAICIWNALRNNRKVVEVGTAYLNDHPRGQYNRAVKTRVDYALSMLECESQGKDKAQLQAGLMQQQRNDEVDADLKHLDSDAGLDSCAEDWIIHRAGDQEPEPFFPEELVDCQPVVNYFTFTLSAIHRNDSVAKAAHRESWLFKEYSSDSANAMAEVWRALSDKELRMKCHDCFRKLLSAEYSLRRPEQDLDFQMSLVEDVYMANCQWQQAIHALVNLRQRRADISEVGYSTILYTMGMAYLELGNTRVARDLLRQYELQNSRQGPSHSRSEYEAWVEREVESFFDEPKMEY